MSLSGSGFSLAVSCVPLLHSLDSLSASLPLDLSAFHISLHPSRAFHFHSLSTHLARLITFHPDYRKNPISYVQKEVGRLSFGLWKVWPRLSGVAGAGACHHRITSRDLLCAPDWTSSVGVCCALASNYFSLYLVLGTIEWI